MDRNANAVKVPLGAADPDPPRALRFSCRREQPPPRTFQDRGWVVQLSGRCFEEPDPSSGPGIALTREQILSVHNRYSAIGTSGAQPEVTKLRSPAVGQLPPDDLIRAVGEPKSPGTGQVMVIPPLVRVMGVEELGSPLAV